jgi:hypothetical protein
MFTPQTRAFYGLERLWGDAERIEITPGEPEGLIAGTNALIAAVLRRHPPRHPPSLEVRRPPLARASAGRAHGPGR